MRNKVVQGTCRHQHASVRDNSTISALTWGSWGFAVGSWGVVVGSLSPRGRQSDLDQPVSGPQEHFCPLIRVQKGGHRDLRH